MDVRDRYTISLIVMQYLERSSAGFDLKLVTVFSAKNIEKIIWVGIYLLGVIFESISSQ